MCYSDTSERELTSSMDELTAEFPMLALTLHRNLRPASQKSSQACQSTSQSRHTSMRWMQHDSHHIKPFTAFLWQIPPNCKGSSKALSRTTLMHSKLSLQTPWASKLP